MAKSPDKPSHPSPMHDLELVVCCTLCMHKGLLAALVVPPPPSPPILLANLPEAQQGNTTNIVMKVRLGALGRSDSRSFSAGQPPPPLGRISMRGSSGESSRHHLRESTHPRGFPNPCRSQCPPSALGRRLWPSVDLGHYGPAALSPRGTLQQLNLLQEDRNITMSFPKAQSVTSASAVPKQRLITPESAILRHGTRTVV
jgi:hypothetical protein